MYQHLAPYVYPLSVIIPYMALLSCVYCLKYNARQRFILECYYVISSRYFTTTFLPLTM